MGGWAYLVKTVWQLLSSCGVGKLVAAAAVAYYGSLDGPGGRNALAVGRKLAAVGVGAASVLSCGVWRLGFTTWEALVFSGLASAAYVHHCVVAWNPPVAALVAGRQLGRLSSAATTCADVDGELPSPRSTASINSTDFYAEYHSHQIADVVTLRQGLEDAGCRRFIYLCGDSSLDNKHWVFSPYEEKRKQMLKSVTAPATNGYEQLLKSPTRMVKDVSYHMNQIAASRYGTGEVCTIMSSIEESTIEDRFTSPTGLLVQDRFIRDSITEDDFLVVSVGGNDVALAPTLRTAVNMAMLTRSPCWMIRAGIAPGFGYFVDLFHSRIEDMVLRIVSRRAPAHVLICMIYYPDPTPGGSWADHTLGALGYDDQPEKLQLIIRELFDAVRRRGFPKLQKRCRVTPFPLFRVLTQHQDYEQRVEPSVEGGRKMAEAFLNELIGAENNNSPAQANPR